MGTLEGILAKGASVALIGYGISAGIYAIGEETFVNALQEPYTWKAALAAGLASATRDILEYIVSGPKK